MLPILHIGSLAVPVPALCLMAALWLGLTVAENYADRQGISGDSFYIILFSGLIVGLFGARVGYILSNPTAFLQNPLDVFSFRPEMLDAFSGFAFGLVTILIASTRVKIDFWQTLDLLSPLLAVMGIGLACAHIASGNSFGAETNLPWGIYLWGAKRHPTQFYELIFAILIFFQINKLGHSPVRMGSLFLHYLVLASAASLILEAFHGDSATIFGSIRSVQVFAWLIFAIAFPLLEFKKNKT